MYKFDVLCFCHQVGIYCRATQPLAQNDWRPTVLPSLERLPDQHGRLFQAPERWEELLRRHHCHRGSLNFPSHVATHVNWSSGPAHQGPQDDSVRLLPLLQELAGTKSCKTSYHHFEGNQSFRLSTHPLVCRLLECWSLLARTCPSPTSQPSLSSCTPGR